MPITIESAMVTFLIRRWLHRGLLAPSDAVQSVGALELRSEVMNGTG